MKSMSQQNVINHLSLEVQKKVRIIMTLKMSLLVINRYRKLAIQP